MPDWYLILEACPMMRISPWEIDPEDRSLIFWREAALEKLGAERWAERQFNRRAQEDNQSRRRNRRG